MDYSLAQKISIWALPVLLAITLHEVAHGWVASLFGDQTARYSGRLTLNPFKHIDIIGTVVVPLLLFFSSGFIFGWAKPVPVDARNMQNPRRDMAIVSIAGPLSNIVMAICWGGIAKLGIALSGSNDWIGEPANLMGMAGIQINIILAVLNCLPIPPLDGGRVLLNILPGRLAWRLQGLERYSFLLLVLLMVSGILQHILLPPSVLLMQWILDIFSLA
jgi:Zn-dependent protease